MMDTFANSPKSGRAIWRVGRWAPVTVGFLAALALAPVEGVARQPGPSGTPTQSAAVRAQIRLEALATNDDGPTGVQRCESRSIRAVGGDAVTFLVAGNRDAPTLCDAGFSPQRPDGPAFYLWRFDTRVLAATEARTTLAVSWTRWRRDEQDATGSRTVTLAPGDYHILDFVPAPGGPPSPCANLEIRLAADPVPQDEPRPELTYDLWLTQEGPLGRHWSHRQVRGRSSDPVTFTLDPLAWSVRGVALTGTADVSAVRVTANGTIRATLGPDGFVDVSVNTDRTVSWCKQDLGDGGRQSYRARLGEAVALVLPDPATTAAVPVNVCSNVAAPAVQLKGARAVMDFGRFFSGNQASLTIVVSRGGPPGIAAGR